MGGMTRKEEGGKYGNNREFFGSSIEKRVESNWNFHKFSLERRRADGQNGGEVGEMVLAAERRENSR